MARRDNGLTSDEWLPLADVEAALTGHVLDALAEAGIPAYAETSVGSGDLAALWGPTAPGRSGAPSDRIHVARAERSSARALLADLLPELRAELATERQAVEDAAWTQIVSGIEAEGGLDAKAQANANPATNEATESADEGWDQAPVAPQPALDASDEDHFVPPAAPPLPTADPVTRAAWVGVIAGPLFLLLATLLDWQSDGLAALLAVAAFVGGFVTLVARMKDRPTIEDSGDDGAVV